MDAQSKDNGQSKDSHPLAPREETLPARCEEDLRDEFIELGAKLQRRRKSMRKDFLYLLLATCIALLFPTPAFTALATLGIFGFLLMVVLPHGVQKLRQEATRQELLLHDPTFDPETADTRGALSLEAEESQPHALMLTKSEQHELAHQFSVLTNLENGNIGRWIDLLMMLFLAFGFWITDIGEQLLLERPLLAISFFLFFVLVQKGARHVHTKTEVKRVRLRLLDLGVSPRDLERGGALTMDNFTSRGLLSARASDE